MAITSCFPPEIYRYGIFPSLTVCGTHRFSQVSKAAHAIVQAVATAPQEDFDLSGERVTIWLDGSIAAYLRQKNKMDILARQPVLLVDLRRVRADSITDGHDPKNIKSLFTHAVSDSSPIAVPLIVLFDLNTKQIQSEDGKMLERALIEAFPNFELMKAVFSHPNAANISAHGLKSFLDHVDNDNYTSEHQLKFLKFLFSHPNAANMPVESLQFAMSVGVKNGDLAFVQMLFAHPNGVKIPVEDISYCVVPCHLFDFGVRWSPGTGLDSAFQIAVDQNHYELTQLILAHPNADKIEHPGLDACQIQ